MDNQDKILLSIAQGEKMIYWRFEGEKPPKMVHEEKIIGVCEELVDLFAYWEFKKQSDATQGYIVETIIQQKKKEGKFTEMDYSIEQESDE